MEGRAFLLPYEQMQHLDPTPYLGAHDSNGKARAYETPQPAEYVAKPQNPALQKSPVSSDDSSTT
jgi:hypothetical protein